MIYCRRSEERLYFISKCWMQRDEIIVQMTLLLTTFPLFILLLMPQHFLLYYVLIDILKFLSWKTPSINYYEYGNIYWARGTFSWRTFSPQLKFTCLHDEIYGFHMAKRNVSAVCIPFLTAIASC